jgi:hypothetical protein
MPKINNIWGSKTLAASDLTHLSSGFRLYRDVLDTLPHIVALEPSVIHSNTYSTSTQHLQHMRRHSLVPTLKDPNSETVADTISSLLERSAFYCDPWSHWR